MDMGVIPDPFRRCRCRSGAVSGVELFAPATTWIPNEIPMENPNWNSHGCRSKLLQRLFAAGWHFWKKLGIQY